MSDTSRHDTWRAGDSYDLYMGRWSRRIAPRFLAWLDPAEQLNWLELGCGTGALSAAILGQCRPKSILAIDPSESFLRQARANVADERVRFLSGDAQQLPLSGDSIDVVVSALVLNFLPDRESALKEMNRVARPGARLAFYVWDYPDDGVEFMSVFWRAAVSLDPGAEEFSEDKHFTFCRPEPLTAMVEAAGFSSISCEKIEAISVFEDFEDFWRPFTLGAGPAPGYCMSLEPRARERLRARLSKSLPRDEQGAISLGLGAWAVKATAS